VLEADKPRQTAFCGLFVNKAYHFDDFYKA